jgi:hypothetical protein
METKCMWEILVPTEKRIKPPLPEILKLPMELDCFNENEFRQFKKWQKSCHYSTKYHQVWDEKVRAISGGLTILTPAKGQWVSPTGELYAERMIPVRIIATREQIEQIADMTMVYYDQLAVLCYKVSEEVILKHRS